MPAPLPVTVRVSSLEEIFALRHRELRPALPRETALFEGDHEPTTLHVGAFLVPAGDNVGCASFMHGARAGEPAYQLRGMATRADVTGRGVGRAVLRFGEGEILRRTAVRCLWCNARLSAIPFYVTMGWVVVSDVFDVPTVGPHRVMSRTLS